MLTLFVLLMGKAVRHFNHSCFTNGTSIFVWSVNTPDKDGKVILSGINIASLKWTRKRLALNTFLAHFEDSKRRSLRERVTLTYVLFLDLDKTGNFMFSSGSYFWPALSCNKNTQVRSESFMPRSKSLHATALNSHWEIFRLLFQFSVDVGHQFFFLSLLSFHVTTVQV